MDVGQHCLTLDSTIVSAEIRDVYVGRVANRYDMSSFHMTSVSVTEGITDDKTFVGHMQGLIFCVRARETAVIVNGWKINLPHFAKPH